MFDPTDIRIRSLLAIAVSGGTTPDKRIWNTLVGLGSPMIETTQDALRSLTSDGIACTKDDLLLVGQPDGTLYDILHPYLTDQEESKTRRLHLRQALSSLNGLDRSPIPVLLDEAREVPLTEAWDLPARIERAARDRGLNLQSLSARLSACRHALMTSVLAETVGGYAFPSRWLAKIEGDPETRSMIQALADLWVTGGPPTMQAVVDRTGMNPGTYYRRVDGLLASGRAEVVETWRGQELVSVNIGKMVLESVSLADVLRPISPEDGTQATWAHKALRSYLGLPVAGRLDVEAIIRAAEAIPGHALRRLPAEIEAHYMETGRNQKTARNAASAVRHVLREAATKGHVPMIWGSDSEEEWERTKDLWFPSGHGRVEGATRATRLRHRTCWSYIREALADISGRDALPTDLTVAAVGEVSDWLRRRGRWNHAAWAHTALVFAGKRGYGPLVGKSQITVPFLMGGGNLKTLDGFLACLDDHDLGPEWAEFWRWYHRYSTKPARTLRKDPSMPTRPGSRKLRGGSFSTRYTACRLVLGILQESGHDLSSLSPEVVFGSDHLRGTIDAMLDLWDDRYRAGELDAPCGSAIRGYVASAGLIAEALYRRRRHSQGKDVSEPPEKKVRWGLDPEAEEEAGKEPVEESLWQAYRFSCGVGDELKEQAQRHGTGNGTNVRKDISAVLKSTPPALFSDLQSAYLRLAHKSLEEDGSSRAHHLLIADAFFNGLIISTGVRGQEAAHLRLDVHCPPSWGEADHDDPIDLTLRAVDRKNDVAHTVTLWPEYVPAWLRMAYMESRAWLMKEGGLLPTDEPSGLSSDKIHQHHQHLIVSPTGKAYGAPEEKVDGEGRPPDKQLERQVNAMRSRWKNSAGRVLWAETDWECPVQDGYWTLHVIRNVMGYSLYQRDPLEAVNYLGDSLKAVRLAYAGVGGQHISRSTFSRAAAWDGNRVDRSRHGPGGGSGLQSQLEDAMEEIRRLKSQLGKG